MSSETTLAVPMSGPTTPGSPNDPQIQLQGRMGVSNNQPGEIENIYNRGHNVQEVGDVEKTTPPGPSPPPDGGYGWVCVACVFVVCACTWGLNSVIIPLPQIPLFMPRTAAFVFFRKTDPPFTRLMEYTSPTTFPTISTPVLLPTTTPSSGDSPSPPP